MSQNKRRPPWTVPATALSVMVATDIAARGIDVLRVSHVINYDMPDTTDAYTHRIGRTGHAERKGDAFTFITGEDEQLIRKIEQVLGAKIERRTLKDFNYTKSRPAQVRICTLAAQARQEPAPGPVEGLVREHGMSRPPDKSPADPKLHRLIRGAAIKTRKQAGPYVKPLGPLTL